MKARVISSLALPAALATAGLLNTAEASYAAALGQDALTASAASAYQGQPMSGDVTLIPGVDHPCKNVANVTISDYSHCCPPIANVTISNYGHCCPPIANVTISDYGHCCTPVANMTICDYGHHHGHRSLDNAAFLDGEYAPGLRIG
ncbi:hypothetical protein ACFYZJ_30115 [Streptomyces sp. NPDC001848]|uniref:hypothetical protein n=1 Tax=Streptomyces sp. NPDC001848 TaxID=3364618 RepID=UPI0036C75695